MITIVLPTMNRPDFLARSLKYYADTGCQHWIYIGDSSSQEYAPKIKQIVDNFTNRLKISHFECPGLSVPKTVHSLNRHIKTPYAAYVSDDDFLVTRGLNECARFLDQNSEYIAANGRAIILTLSESGAYGDLRKVGLYPMLSLEDQSGSKRLKNFFERYFVNLFSVHRTEFWKDMWAGADTITDIPFCGELLPCGLSAVKGKTRHLESLYLVRQEHDKRSKPYLMTSNYQWMTSEHWQPSYQKYKGVLSAALQQQDNISEQEADFIVQESFWFYMTKYFYQKYLREHGLASNTKQRIKAILGKIPGANEMILSPAKYIVGKIFPDQALGLPNMLSPKSPDSKDFLAIYESLVGNNSVKL